MEQNTQKANSTLGWVALIVAIIALILGWVAFNRSGSDLETLIQEEIDETQQEIEVETDAMMDAEEDAAMEDAAGE